METRGGRAVRGGLGDDAAAADAAMFPAGGRTCRDPGGGGKINDSDEELTWDSSLSLSFGNSGSKGIDAGSSGEEGSGCDGGDRGRRAAAVVLLAASGTSGEFMGEGAAGILVLEDDLDAVLLLPVREPRNGCGVADRDSGGGAVALSPLADGTEFTGSAMGVPAGGKVLTGKRGRGRSVAGGATVEPAVAAGCCATIWFDAVADWSGGGRRRGSTVGLRGGRPAGGTAAAPF